jgi:4-aminobutyrate aminotransferase-like enzyme
VTEAIVAQLSRTQYVHGTMFTTGALERYADELAPLLPMDDARIYPVSGGSEAVETALKLARSYHLARGEPSRFVVIARRSSYHGNTLGALDASGKEPLRKPYTPWLGRFLHAPAAYEYRCENPSHPQGCGAWHAAELERMISQAPPSSVAAFIAEPVAGATLGAAVPCDDYWSSIVEVCREHGILVIADEVQSGMGRTGRLFASEHFDFVPDILVTAKSIAGGLPLAAVVGRADVMDAPGVGSLGSTFGGNPLAMAAAHAVLDMFDESPLLPRAEVIGARIAQRAVRWAAACDLVGDVRRLGAMAAVELVRDRVTREPAREETTRLLQRVAEGGVLMIGAGTYGNVVRVLVPLVVSDDELDEGLDVIESALGKVSA